jgi:hypothetical protein
VNGFWNAHFSNKSVCRSVRYLIQLADRNCSITIATMSVHYHSANVRCLSPEQVVHLQYYTNSLFEDDLHQTSSRRFCHHHDPYHDRLTKFATERRSLRKKRSITDKMTSSHLPVLSAEDPYSTAFWATAIDRMVFDFCCAMVDYDAALPSGSSMSDVKTVDSISRRRRRVPSR